jgi:hypothetical protein
MSSSTPKVVPAAPVPQTVAPVAAPVTPKHLVEKHRRKYAIHRAPTATAESDEAPAAEPANRDANAKAKFNLGRTHLPISEGRCSS